MSYSAFIDAFMKIKEKEETDRIFRMMAAIKSATNV
jgi:pentatricopeptide repeat protein